MNDLELDEMLNRWKTPDVPPSLRERVRERFKVGKIERKWWTMFFGKKFVFGALAAGATALLLAAAQSAPPTFQAILGKDVIPFVVESQETSYGDDGAAVRNESLKSFTDVYGNEMILSVSVEDHPLQSLINSTGEIAGLFLHQLIPVFHPDTDKSWRLRHDTLVGSGCTPTFPDYQVVGHEVFLNHPVTVIRHTRATGEKTTEWQAPDLGCFRLKMTREVPNADGTYRLATLKVALKVNP